MKIMAGVQFVLISPVLIVLGVVVFLFSGWPIIYKQKRVGRKGKVFEMYKFRTMEIGAEEKQAGLRSQNEADGPAFKMEDDPRFTKIGKFLSHTGVDELPQFFNIFLGNMNLVGPRPLPVAEAQKIPKKYKEVREQVKPGIISPWLFEGYHRLSFEKWMESDCRYVKKRSFSYDSALIARAIGEVGKMIIKEIRL